MGNWQLLWTSQPGEPDDRIPAGWRGTATYNALARPSLTSWLNISYPGRLSQVMPSLNMLRFKSSGFPDVASR